MPERADGGRTVIESLGVYLPAREVSTEEILRGCRAKIRFPLERMTGIKARRVAGETEFAIDLAKKAITRCLDGSRHGPDDIDLLISVAIARVDAPGFMVAYEPSTSLRLKKDLGFRRAMTFDVRSACSGMFAAINIVDTLIRQGTIERGMVVSGEYITHLTTTAQYEIDEMLDPRLACLTLGDSGVAVVLEASSDGAGFDAIDLRTYGRFAELCVAGPTDGEHGGAIMFTDALNLTDAAARYGSDHALETIRRAGWSSDDFQHLIMHQTSRTALSGAMREINRLMKRRVCHAGNTINNLERRGNTATTTHFVALADHIQNRRIQSGDRVIFAVSGSGLTVGTALYALDDLPDRMHGAASPRLSNGGGRGPRRAPSAARRIHIESIGVAPRTNGERRDTLSLLKAAATDCLQRSARDLSSVGLIIYAGVYRSRYVTEPAIAALLAGELDGEGPPDTQRWLAFDVFNGSVGVLNACYVAAEMLRAGKAPAALVVASEVENNAESFPTDLLGTEETGSAVLIELAPDGSRTGFGEFLFRSFPEHVDAFTSHLTNRDGKTYLQVSRHPDLERLYRDAIVAGAADLLDRESVGMTQVSRIFAPQISTSFLRCLAQALDVAPERFVDVAGDGGDLFTSSLPFALRHALTHELVHPGDVGLVITAGSGIQVGCALYHF